MKCNFLEESLQCGKQAFPPIEQWELVTCLKPVNFFILRLFDYVFETKLIFMIKFFGKLGLVDK